MDSFSVEVGLVSSISSTFSAPAIVLSLRWEYGGGGGGLGDGGGGGIGTGGAGDGGGRGGECAQQQLILRTRTPHAVSPSGVWG